MKEKKDFFRIKLVVLAIFFIVVFFVLWGRAFYVQIIWGPELAAKAERQYWNTETLQGRRGEIFDRDGRLLAKSVKSRSVFVRPLEIKDPYATASFLAKTLDLKRAGVLSQLKSKKKFVWIAKGISDKQVYELEQHKVEGVCLAHDTTRFYPQSHLAGQLLGFVGLDGVGLEGLEKSLNKMLSGKTAKQIVQRDAVGASLYGAKEDLPSLHGENIVLTIDSSAQFVAEDNLARRIKEVKGAHGSALVIDVKTGDILAWATYPFFNPNSYSSYRPVDWRNRIALDNFEPGSILKPFLIAAALQEKTCSASSVYFCENGKWNVGSKTIRDTHDYAWMSVDRILRFSSNIGCAKIGFDLGAKTYFRYLESFGFTESCGLPLPGEGRGLIAPPGRWRKLELATASFGQGVAVTSLQMARAYLCLLNEGHLLPLRLLAGSKPDKKMYPQVVDSNVARSVIRMMDGAVNDEGTATMARLQGVRVGGKTGTAQKPDSSGGYGRDYLASFVGFFPVEDPQYLILVSIDSPKTSYYGSVVTIPVFREIAEYFLATSTSSSSQKEAARTIPETKGNIQGRITASPQKFQPSERVPDLRGVSLRQAVECAVRNGVLPEIRGKGTIVKKHSPEKGKKWGKKMVLWLEDL